LTPEPKRDASSRPNPQVMPFMTLFISLHFLSYAFMIGTVVSISTDGFLRAFDMPTMIWPGGYVMTQVVSSPSFMTKFIEGKQTIRVLELGSGCGLVAVALGLALESLDAKILATDKEARSLLLVTENIVKHGISNVATSIFDFSNDDSLDEHCFQPFDIVIGASLQWDDQALWPPGRLSYVLSKCVKGNGGLAFLAHRPGALFSATDLTSVSGNEGGVEVLHRISGDAVGAFSRSGPSELEVVVARVGHPTPM